MLAHSIRPVAMLRTTICHIPSVGPSTLLRQQATHQSRFASSSGAAAFQRPPSVFQTSALSAAFKSAASGGVASRTMIGAGAATTCLVGPLIYSRSMMASSMSNSNSMFVPRVAHCAAAPIGTRYDDYGLTKEPLINSKELTFGMAMGLCSGYLFKKLGKLMMLVVGLGFVSLQLLVNSGYVHVNWKKIEGRFVDQFDVDRDGKVTVNDAKHGFRWLMNLLTKNFQFKSTFVGGFVLGFRHG
ncbi:FUN14 domain-containing protein 1 [Linnemannia schmuckeri]|uniref:FUN14 domain-containing protein 1 n=1 Tax=Linnemannia schmuckeri TaxID=64567 RepID=A0A9P5RYX0_9FUNG|nr:FUN14 domain-containing protein 1 [Linnemannia schmuckeri]